MSLEEWILWNYINDKLDAAYVYVDLGNAVTVVQDSNGKYIFIFYIFYTVLKKIIIDTLNTVQYNGIEQCLI